MIGSQENMEEERLEMDQKTKVVCRISVADSFTEREAAEIMMQVCLAVSSLHDMDIAHRWTG